MKLNGFFSMRRIATAAALVGALAGCNDLSTDPASLGRVTVTVKDQNNAGVGLIPVDLLLADGLTIWRSLRTSLDGTGEFGKADGGVRTQPYVVRLDLGTDYELPAGETNDKPVVVVSGQTHAVTFNVRKKGKLEL